MSSAPQTTRVRRSSARELLEISRSVNAEFRIERGIAIGAVSISFIVMLVTAAMAARHGDWQGSQAMLFGSGGICTAGFGGLFYMYNRSFQFLERMAGGNDKEAKNE